MTYQEICRALHGEQMKKEAGMKKEASVKKLAGLLVKRKLYPAGVWDTGVVPTDPKTLSTEEATEQLSLPEPKITPVKSLDSVHPIFRSDLKNEKGLVKVTPPETGLPSYYSTKDKIKDLMSKYKQLGESQSWLKHFTLDPRKWVK